MIHAVLMEEGGSMRFKYVYLFLFFIRKLKYSFYIILFNIFFIVYKKKIERKRKKYHAVLWRLLLGFIRHQNIRKNTIGTYTKLCYLHYEFKNEV